MVKGNPCTSSSERVVDVAYLIRSRQHCLGLKVNRAFVGP